MIVKWFALKSRSRYYDGFWVAEECADTDIIHPILVEASTKSGFK